MTAPVDDLVRRLRIMPGTLHERVEAAASIEALQAEVALWRERSAEGIIDTISSQAWQQRAEAAERRAAAAEGVIAAADAMRLHIDRGRDYLHFANLYDKSRTEYAAIAAQDAK